jgi:hypothetical protein
MRVNDQVSGWLAVACFVAAIVGLVLILRF